MRKEKSVGKNAVLNGIRTLLNTLFPLITFPYVSRILSVESVGKYNFALSVVQYFLLLAALGISTYSIREGTKYRDHAEKFSLFASELFTINIVSTVLAYLLLALSIICVTKFHEYAVVLSVFSIEILFTTIGTEWIYSIYEEYAYITIRSILFKLLSIVLLFTLVKHENDYIIYALITVIANAGSNIMNFIHARKYVRLRLVFNGNLKKHMIPILIIFASTVATTIYVNSDTTMLGFMATDYEVGIYSVSAKIYRLVKQMLAAILIVSIPRLSLLMGQNKLEEYKAMLTQVFNVLVMLVLPAVVGMFMLSKEIILLISGDAYVNATTSLQLLSVALIFCIFGWFYNQCVLIPAKREKIVFAATTISAVANIIINLVLIPVWKENAAAVSTIAAEAIMMLVCVYDGRKIIKLNKGVVRNTISVGLGSAGVAAVCIAVKNIGLSSVITLVISVFASVIVYAVILIVTHNELLFGYLVKLKGKK